MSNKEETEPTHDEPVVNNNKPTRKELRNDMPDSILEKSSIGSAESGHTGDLSKAGEPTVAKSRTKTRESRCPKL